MNRSCGSSEFWLRVRGVAVVGALVLVGCSSGGGDDTSSEPRKTDSTASADDESVATDVEVDEEDDVAQSAVAGEPVSHLPFDGAAPDGYRMITGECKANAEALADLEAAGEYDFQSPITFAVPEDWISRGKGSGGAGVTGTDLDLGFETPSSGEVSVDYEWDERGSGGVIYDGREVWESFDSEYIYKDVATVVTYEQVATVSIQDQTVELFYRDPSQAPGLVDGEEYKARVSAFDIPGSVSTSDGMSYHSLVFTISFDGDTAEVDQDVVEAIIGSVNLPTCVWDDLLLSEEVFRQIDLNGDGQVKSMEEWQAEFQKQLDELEATVDD